MIGHITDCRGCAECIGCGRNRPTEVLLCDNCKNPLWYDTPKFLYYGDDYCEECLYQKFLKDVPEVKEYLEKEGNSAFPLPEEFEELWENFKEDHNQ